jgi:hypothetical protein
MLNIGDEIETRAYVDDLMKENTCFVSLMETYCGKRARITDISLSWGEPYYRIDIDNGDWWWEELLFVPIIKIDWEKAFNDLYMIFRITCMDNMRARNIRENIIKENTK